LLRRLPSSCYSKYVGIDLSESAISVAQQHANERSTFLAADCEEYLPTQQFDVIVFNEVLCCLRDPLRTVDRYARALNPGGVLLVSLCTAGRGTGNVLSGLKQAYATVDEVRIVHSGRKVSWLCTALRPEARSERD
jgi:2-polyprenyl-3-methyl-5-hydroxy-6-metoxy-1,4-benzoquinol methylase